MLPILLTLLAADLTDPVAIVQRLTAADAANRPIAQQYVFLEETEEREFDKKNRLEKRTTETREVVFLYGRPYERLIAKNGQPLTGKELAKEEAKFQKESSKRQRESEQDRARLAKQDEKRRNELRQLIDEIVKAYELTLLGIETIDARRVYRIQAEPRSNYQRKLPPYSFLRRLRGQLWIDAEEFQLVRVEAEVIEDFSFGLFLARLAKGSQLRFAQTRVNGEVWLPQEAFAKIDGRFLTDRFRGENLVRWSGYRKFQSDSRILETAEIP